MVGWEALLISRTLDQYLGIYTYSQVFRHSSYRVLLFSLRMSEFAISHNHPLALLRTDLSINEASVPILLAPHRLSFLHSSCCCNSQKVEAGCSIWTRQIWFPRHILLPQRPSFSFGSANAKTSRGRRRRRRQRYRQSQQQPRRRTRSASYYERRSSSPRRRWPTVSTSTSCDGQSHHRVVHRASSFTPPSPPDNRTSRYFEAIVASYTSYCQSRPTCSRKTGAEPK